MPDEKWRMLSDDPGAEGRRRSRAFPVAFLILSFALSL
jgi:hypothetical protein